MAEREDKRLDDLVLQVNHGFARVDGEISGLRTELREARAELRAEMNQGFARVDGEIAGLRTELGKTRAELRAEMHEGFARVDKQFDRVDTQFDRIDKQFERIHRWAIALVVAMVGLFGANLVQGIGG